MEDLYPKHGIAERDIIRPKKFDFEGISKLLQDLKVQESLRKIGPSNRPKSSMRKPRFGYDDKLFELNNMTFNISYSSSESQGSTDSTDNYTEPVEKRTQKRGKSLNTRLAKKVLTSQTQKPSEVVYTENYSVFQNAPVRNAISAPSVSAKCWVVVDGNTGDILYGKRNNVRCEIASLTKIMTCYTACLLLDEYAIDAKNTHILISKNASQMVGTNAQLKYGDIVSIWDLLHGLMLPSGNDAAFSLAESFGTYIYMQTESYKSKVKSGQELSSQDVKNSIPFFIKKMNVIARQLGLRNTVYANPHGLMDHPNLSTASDVSKLAVAAMKLERFREIVFRQTYECAVEQADKSVKQVRWENTNKLLSEGWQGVKTGVTKAAGPCFCGFITIDSSPYVVTVLGSESLEFRWVDCRILSTWVHSTRKNI